MGRSILIPKPILIAQPSQGRLAAPLILLGIYLGLVLPLIFARAGGTSEYADEVEYHLPIIRVMESQWPNVDIQKYESATSPGFHLLMAGILKFTDSLLLIKLVNAGFGAALLLACYAVAARFAGAWIGLLLTLPLAFSSYVLGASIWLTTDNAALLFVACALGSIISLPTTPLRLVRSGVFAACAVGVRQLHVWLAAPIGLAGLLASPLAILVPFILREEPPSGYKARTSSWNFIAGVFAAALPFAVLVYLMRGWGWALMPQCSGWVKLHSMGPNPASPAFALTLVAVLGVFFLPIVWDQFQRLKLSDRAVWFVLLIGLTIALIPETSFLWKSRSYGWLWIVVDRLPEFAGRSIVITLGAPLGCLGLLLLYRGARDAGRHMPALILLLSLLGWLLAQTFNSMAWQRYFEPVTLMGLGWLAAMGTRPAIEPLALTAPYRSCWPWCGPLLLAAIQISYAMLTTFREAIGSIMTH